MNKKMATVFVILFLLPVLAAVVHADPSDAQIKQVLQQTSELVCYGISWYEVKDIFADKSGEEILVMAPAFELRSKTQPRPYLGFIYVQAGTSYRLDCVRQTKKLYLPTERQKIIQSIMGDYEGSEYFWAILAYRESAKQKPTDLLSNDVSRLLTDFLQRDKVAQRVKLSSMQNLRLLSFGWEEGRDAVSPVVTVYLAKENQTVSFNFDHHSTKIKGVYPYIHNWWDTNPKVWRPKVATEQGP